MLSIVKPQYIIVFYILCFILYSMGWDAEYLSVSSESILVFSLDVFFLFLGFLASYLTPRTRFPVEYKLNMRYVYLFYVLSTLLLLFEHVVFYFKFGSIPILNSDFEILRMNFMVSGYIHVIAMSSYLFSSIIFLEEKNNIKLKLICVSITLILFFLMGNRAEFIAFSFILFSIQYRNKISSFKFILFCVIMLVGFGITRLVRDYAFYGDDVYNSINNVWPFGDSVISAVFYYIYVGLTYNFHAFNQYISAIHNFHYGYFTLLYPWLTIFTSNVYTLKDMQQDVLGVYFHGTITPTMFTIPYADYGLFSCFIFLFIGLLWGMLYKHAKNNEPGFYLFLMYLTWNLVMGMYEYMFYKFYVIFNFFVIFCVYKFFASSKIKID